MTPAKTSTATSSRAKPEPPRPTVGAAGLEYDEYRYTGQPATRIAHAAYAAAERLDQDDASFLILAVPRGEVERVREALAGVVQYA